MWREFRDFAMRGKCGRPGGRHHAVGIILGAAVTTIVNSLVNDILPRPQA